MVVLQWGHVFSDVETKKRAAPSHRGRHASMGPRLFRRGNTTKINKILNMTAGFNGATSFQTWKHNEAVKTVKFSARLQWGHVFSDVETGLSGVNVLATFWLQWGHVFSDVETNHGNINVKTGVRLQWGHVFSDVETRIEAGMTVFDVLLQWGHVFSDVETALLRIICF